MSQLQELSSKLVSTNRFAFLLFLFGINALFFPYAGYQHDSVFYAFQVLNKIEPGKFSLDLFFLFGSQDSWSIFSAVAAPFVSIFGLDLGVFMLYVTAKIFFLYGCFRLVLLVSSSPLNAVITIVIIASRSQPYAGFAMLNVNESFLTPRIVAEGLVLLGLSLFISKHHIRGVLVLLLATLFHPLISSAGWGVFFLYIWINLWIACDHNKRIILMLSTILVLAVPFYLGLTFAPFDADWWALIKDRSTLNFITEWWATDYINLAFALAVVVFSVPCLPKRGRIAALAVIVLSFGAGLITLLAEYFGSILILKLQFYRCFWILLFASIVFGVELVSKLWRSDVHFSKSVGVLLGCFISRDLLFSFSAPIWILIAAICCFGSYAYLRLRERQTPFWEVAPSLVLRTFISFYLFLLVWNTGYLIVEWLVSKDMGKLGHTYGVVRNMLAGPILLYLLFCLAKRTALFERAIFKSCFIFFLSGLLALVAGYFFAIAQTFTPKADLDKKENRSFVLSYFSSLPQEKMALLPKTYTVYWPLETRTVWFKLRANQYFDNIQLAGLMFSRGTAVEGKRRLGLVKPFELFSLTKDDMWGKKNAWLLGLYKPRGPSSEPELADLHRVCAEPLVNFAILEHNFNIKDAATNGKVFIYDCDAIRKEQRL